MEEAHLHYTGRTGNYQNILIRLRFETGDIRKKRVRPEHRNGKERGVRMPYS